MKQRLLAQRLLALFVAGCLLLNFPLPRIAEAAGTWLGLPAFVLWFFGAWVGLIVVLALLLERTPDDDDAPPADAEP